MASLAPLSALRTAGVTRPSFSALSYGERPCYDYITRANPHSPPADDVLAFIIVAKNTHAALGLPRSASAKEVRDVSVLVRASSNERAKTLLAQCEVQAKAVYELLAQQSSVALQHVASAIERPPSHHIADVWSGETPSDPTEWMAEYSAAKSSMRSWASATSSALTKSGLARDTSLVSHIAGLFSLPLQHDMVPAKTQVRFLTALMTKLAYEVLLANHVHYHFAPEHLGWLGADLSLSNAAFTLFRETKITDFDGLMLANPHFAAWASQSLRRLAASLPHGILPRPEDITFALDNAFPAMASIVTEGFASIVGIHCFVLSPPFLSTGSSMPCDRRIFSTTSPTRSSRHPSSRQPGPVTPPTTMPS